MINILVDQLAIFYVNTGLVLGNIYLWFSLDFLHVGKDCPRATYYKLIIGDFAACDSLCEGVFKDNTQIITFISNSLHTFLAI